MARVTSNCVTLLVQRRGFSVTTSTIEGIVKQRKEKAVKFATAAEKDVATPTATATEERMAVWVPDPTTGYYRPMTGVKELDAADLRAVLLTQKMEKE